MNVLNSFATVIMAAGKGTRMKDPTKAKVMYEVLGKPLLYYVVETAKQLGSAKIVVIVGYQRESVIQFLSNSFPKVEIAIQAEQLGTGHAIMQAEDPLKYFKGDIIILSGDVPLLSIRSVQLLLGNHKQQSADATILTAEFTDPSGYGRIIRNENGYVKRIIEHKDASEEERKVKEINSGIYVFKKEKLFKALKYIKPQNAQNEYYLTDVFEYFWKQKWKVSALKVSKVKEIMGVNTIDQLKEVELAMISK
jgi:UDP-N-acetylglucosamine pyrophosphorylase